MTITLLCAFGALGMVYIIFFNEPKAKTHYWAIRRHARWRCTEQHFFCTLCLEIDYHGQWRAVVPTPLLPQRLTETHVFDTVAEAYDFADKHAEEVYAATSILLDDIYY